MAGLLNQFKNPFFIHLFSKFSGFFRDCEIKAVKIDNIKQDMD
jgi:hypothetical protein